MFSNLGAQTYNDGPMELQVRLVRFQADFANFDDLTINLGPLPVPPTISRDEYSFKIWGRANFDVNGTNWQDSVCVNDTVDVTANINSIQFDTVFYSDQFAGASVPRYFDLRVEAWEDDVPTDFDLVPGCFLGNCNICETTDGYSQCLYEPSQLCIDPLIGPNFLDEGDDRHCDAPVFSQQHDYRAAGPPCQWNSHGVITGACTTEVYRPEIESFWRYLNGDSCQMAIDMGALTPGFTSLTPNFNSNECYTDAITTAGGGQDVVYGVTVTDPVGLSVNTNGAGTLQSDLVILDGNCSQIAFNSGAPNTGSQIDIPLCAPGTYYIVVEGRAASLGTFTLSITENPSLVVDAEAGQDQTMCIGSNTVIGGAPTANAGQPGYDYQWSGIGTLSDDTLANPVAFPQNTTTYYVTVTDQNGCVSIDSMTVIVSPGPSLTIGPDTSSVCPGDSVFLNAGTGFTNYFWSNGSTDSSIYAISPGVYFVAVTDILGCLGRDTVFVDNDAAPTVDIGRDTSICANVDLTLDAGAGYQYQWSAGGQTSQTISVNTANTYFVTVTDPGTSCQTVDSIVVGIDTLPQLALGGPQDLCPGDTLLLDAGAGLADYQWSTGSNDQIIFVGDSGTYEVVITNSFGCSDTDAVAVNLFALPTVDLGADQDLCPGDEVELDAGAGFNAYEWLTGETTQTLMVSESGAYLVVVTDGNGCKARDTVQVSVQQLPVVALGPDQEICPNEQITLDAGSGFTSYLWSTMETTQTITVVDPGTYSVEVAAGPCPQSDEIVIGDNCPGEIIMPNVFSPNGDGINDLFDVQGVNVLEYDMSIYDRWGKLLFTTTALTNMWDGKFNGKDMPEGVYYFHVEYQISGREAREEKKGALTLMR